MPTFDRKAFLDDRAGWLNMPKSIELLYACPHCGDVHPFRAEQGDLIDVNFQLPACPRTARDVKVVCLNKEPIVYCRQ